jgi:hypothetical protein
MHLKLRRVSTQKDPAGSVLEFKATWDHRLGRPAVEDVEMQGVYWITWPTFIMPFFSPPFLRCKYM